MIIIHHLGNSQSDRIVWLMEELDLPYELRWYHRNEIGLAPDDYLSLHPAATAPVVTDGDTVIAESAVIAEHICHRHAGGRLTLGPHDSNYIQYLYWIHFHNNILGLFFARSALRTAGQASEPNIMQGVIERRENNYYHYMDQRLAELPYLAGDQLTCADIMVMFDLTTLPLFGGRAIDEFPNIVAYVKRISARPAYIKAMRIAGPSATPPKS